MLLDGGSDIAHRIAHANFLHRTLQGALGDFQQLLQLVRRLAAHRHGESRIGIKAFDHYPTINRDDVAILELALLRRNAVNHFLIHRSAQHTGITVVSLEGGLRAQLLNLFLRHPLQLHGGDPRSDVAADFLQNLPQNLAAAPHFFQLGRILTNDHAQWPSKSPL